MSRYTVSRSEASEIQSASSSPFAEATGTGLPEKLKSKEDPVRAACDNIQPFPLASQPYLPQQKSASFLSSIGLLALLLSHPVGSKHHEIKSSLYP